MQSVNSINTNLDNDKNKHDLSFLTTDNNMRYFRWDKDTKLGIGVLKNNYSLHAKSWDETENSGIIANHITTTAKKEIWGSNLSDKEYIDYLNSELMQLANIIFKEKSVLNTIQEGIKQNEGELERKIGRYVLSLSNESYDEVSVEVQHFAYYSNIYTFTVRSTSPQ